MKSSKHQAPNTREAPGVKHQIPSSKLQKKSKQQTPNKRCLKESKETRFFLRMVAASEPGLAGEARELYREANELVRIFAPMYRK